MRVNRSQMVSSQWRSMQLPRITSVTRVPKAEKTCANSAATKPLPTITRCSGNAGSRMMVSLVWYVTPEAAMAGGTVGREPAAITTWSAVNSFAIVGTQQIAPVGLDRSETRVRAVHIDVGRRAPIVFAARPDRIDAAENPRNDVLPAHPVDVRIHAVPGRTPDRLGHLGGVDEHLGRDAPDVQAGPAEGALLADRDPLGRIALVENAVARTGSNDREVVGLHRCVTLSPTGSPAGPGCRCR